MLCFVLCLCKNVSQSLTAVIKRIILLNNLTLKTMLCALAVIVAILYIFFDVNYFIRVFATLGFGRLCGKKYSVTDTTTIYGKS